MFCRLMTTKVRKNSENDKHPFLCLRLVDIACVFLKMVDLNLYVYRFKFNLCLCSVDFPEIRANLQKKFLHSIPVG